jgi:UDP-N-acetylmuramoylalanine--D-glutamate ligase
LVAGLGLSGESALRFLQEKQQACIAFDTRENFDFSNLQKQFPEVTFYSKKLPENEINKISEVILSPGIPLKSSWLEPFRKNKCPIVGDIELFARHLNSTKKPVIAITGSNGKSTVTSLVAQILQKAGYKVGMGGNIGLPALDLLLDGQAYDVYVLELSSFQLETTFSLTPTAATILNICEDHMDRYDSIEAYVQAKKRIFNGAKKAVLPLTDKRFYSISDASYFSDKKNALTENMLLQGKHYQLNAQAAIALTQGFEVSDEAYKSVFQHFFGLPHRTERVAFKNGVTWINDSKGTNVGATQTAISSLAGDKNIILIAGGVGKEADFSPLKQELTNHVKLLILFGRDAELIDKAISFDKTEKLKTLEQAVTSANIFAEKGDIVLFSPACASFDQFNNYEHRGDVFKKNVAEVLGV